MGVNRVQILRATAVAVAVAGPFAIGGAASARAVSTAPPGVCDWLDASAVADVPIAEATGLIPELETFHTALDAGGLDELLAGEGPFTVFAATNAAIDAVPEAVFTALINDPELLGSIIGFHVVEGQALSAADLASAGTVETLSGALAITDDGGTLVANGQATIACPDISTANGTIHVVDALLQPATDDIGPGGSSSVPGSSVPGSSVPVAGSSVPAGIRTG